MKKIETGKLAKVVGGKEENGELGMDIKPVLMTCDECGGKFETLTVVGPRLLCRDCAKKYPQSK